MSSQMPQTPADAPYLLHIQPENANRKTQLHLVAKGFELSDVKVQWLVNGMPAQSQTPGEFKVSNARKGDTIQAKATMQGQVVLSNSVQIKNSPPEIIKVRLLPDADKPGDTLSVEVEGKDADGDNVTFTYEWTKNGEPAGNGQRINAPLRRGDKIKLAVVPSDGEETGRPIIMQREIKNMSPTILDNKAFKFDGKVYTFQVLAHDPDGDSLTYSLRSAPAGMTINPSTGLVYWNVPPTFTGTALFTVSVSDGQGGEAEKSFSFTIKQS
jgi:hypothetical protein